MSDLPKLALSVRQPWAWAIIFAGKDIENRTWQAVNHGLKRRGRVAVHASKGMGREEYEDARDFINDNLIRVGSPLRCPEPADLIRGGIIGSVEVVDVVSESASDWFMGPRGLVLRDPIACDFIPSVGALGYFEWKRDDSVTVDTPRWMKPEEPVKPKGQRRADGNFLVLEDGRRIGPFSTHWAACAAMVRLTNPKFVSLGGDKPEDLAIERAAFPSSEMNADLQRNDTETREQI